MTDAPSQLDPAATPLAELSAHIVATHHAYCRAEVPHLLRLLQAAAAEAGPNRATLRVMQAGFQTLSAALIRHLEKEESILFPLIERIAAAERDHVRPPSLTFGSVGNPIRMMVLEHSEAEVLLAKMRSESQGFATPADATAVCAEAYAGLRAFDADMKRHVELEDDFLFPRAIAAEDAAGKLS